MVKKNAPSGRDAKYPYQGVEGLLKGLSKAAASFDEVEHILNYDVEILDFINLSPLRIYGPQYLIPSNKF